MKNAIKLFSVLFLVSGVLFLSCDKKNNSSSSGNSNGNSGNSGDTTAEIKVTFGDTTWTAGVWEGADYTPKGNKIFHIAAQEKTDSDVPVFVFFANLSGSTTYSLNDTTVFPAVTFQYLEDVEKMWSFEGDTTIYADWLAYSGTVKVTSYTKGKITGTAAIVMFNAYQSAVEGNQNPETRNLTMTFKNVPLTLVQKSLPSKVIKPNFSIPFGFKTAKSPIKMNF